jgi:hypothetical protein
MRKVNKVLVCKPEANKPSGRQRRKWENNIKMSLKKNKMGGCGLYPYFLG